MEIEWRIKKPTDSMGAEQRGGKTEGRKKAPNKRWQPLNYVAYFNEPKVATFSSVFSIVSFEFIIYRCNKTMRTMI